MDVNLNSSILTSFILLIFLTCELKLLNWVWLRSKKLEKLLRKQGLNGNPCKLLVGDVKEFMSVVNAEHIRSIQFSDYLPSHILPYFKQIIEKYGDNSFMWLGPSPYLLITDLLMMKDILTKPDTFQKPVPDPIGETLGAGLTFLEADKWALHRKIINPVFRVENVKNMTPSIRLSCSNMMDIWESLVSSDGGSNEIDVWPFLYDLSGDIISRTAFGSSHEQGRRIFDLQKEQTKLILQYMPCYFVPWIEVYTTENYTSFSVGKNPRKYTPQK